MTLVAPSDLRAPPDLAPPRQDRGRAQSPDADFGPGHKAVRPVEGAAPAPAEAEAKVRPVKVRRRRLPSKLTLRVLAINILALLILVGGMLYLGRYQERLIQADLESLRTEALTFAGALAEGATVDGPNDVPRLDPDRARQMVRRFYETTDIRVRLFDVEHGGLVADSRLLVGTGGGAVEIEPLAPPEHDAWMRRTVDAAYSWVAELVPRRKRWPAYHERPTQHATDYPVVEHAMLGEIGRQIWTRSDRFLLLGVAVPVQRLRVVIGAVLVSRDTSGIEAAMQSVREEILVVFLVALAITVLLSLYLAGSVTRPIRRLADGAEEVRRGHGRHLAIPDFTHRHDEIGELSGVLRDMTGALWARMDAIERFAADVAHEIKNPLSSLRSAVETTARITDPERQRRLMAIIVQDVQRLDRLITDISDASRLDAELSRAEPVPVDLREPLAALAEIHAATHETGPTVTLEIEGDRPLMVLGLEGRLVQVIRNLLTNAVSFSPPDGTIAIRARRDGPALEVTVTDEGPGIPDGKEEAIFNRFYTERPEGEAFGNHSGLGLSISRQIVEAYGGRITAGNRQDRTGARFTVRLPAA